MIDPIANHILCPSAHSHALPLVPTSIGPPGNGRVSSSAKCKERTEERTSTANRIFF